MKTIKINNKNIYCIVDDEDYERLAFYKWCLAGFGYARTKANGKLQYMHRMILGDSCRNKQVDHVNGNKLDNRRRNLCSCTASENGANRNKPRFANGSTSVYKGVTRKRSGRWIAQIRFRGKLLKLGSFLSEKDAAKAYNHTASELFGGFAKINIFTQGP